MSDDFRLKIEYEGRLYRNEKLKSFIEEMFDDVGQIAAWETVEFIRMTWPETEGVLRGDLIAIDRQGG